MAKCLEIFRLKSCVSVTSVITNYNKILLKPFTVVTPTPSTSFKGRRSLITRNYLKNEVEVVTACSWTEVVVAADMPVLVEFWASSCGPSSPTVDQVAKEYAGKALCYKLNVDDYPNVALQYGITSIPSVLFYVNGENKESYAIDDHVSMSTLCATLDKYLFS